jgi:hypothetical protein
MAGEVNWTAIPTRFGQVIAPGSLPEELGSTLIKIMEVSKSLTTYISRIQE